MLMEMAGGTVAARLPAAAAFGHEKGPRGPVHDACVGFGRVSRSAFPLLDYCKPGGEHT
jgi:hypothetical protein